MVKPLASGLKFNEILGIRMRYSNCAKIHTKKKRSGKLDSKIARRGIFIDGS